MSNLDEIQKSINILQCGYIDKDRDVIAITYSCFIKEIDNIQKSINNLKNAENLIQVLNDGIYYYDKFGKVSSFYKPDVSQNYIKTKIGGKQFSFKWDDLGIKFWLTREEAEQHAKEYLDELTKHTSLKTLKRICNLKDCDSFYALDEDINKVRKRSVGDYYFYMKSTMTFVSLVEYDDDFGGGYYNYEYPISEYGKTWSLDIDESGQLVKG